MTDTAQLIETTNTGDFNSVGTPAQRSFLSVKKLLKGYVNFEFFAEPTPHPNGEIIDWYTGLSGPVKKFSELTPEEKNKTTAQLSELLRNIDQLIELKKQDNKSSSKNSVESLKNLTVVPNDEAIRTVGGRLVLLNWAHVDKNKRQSKFSLYELLKKNLSEEKSLAEVKDLKDTISNQI